ncbi:hypothetical protein K1719_033102 [Acacia pycnantha]|nr:hypothetical protein K1719_033102 [Acacia pycnantha]
MNKFDGSQSDRGGPVEKRVRGSTKMGASVACYQEQRERLHVDFDANMNPIGTEEDIFISYLGYLARNEPEEQRSQGSFTPSERIDILSTTIGKVDHPGRVRGEPRGVGVTTYFGRASQYSSQGKLSRELVAKVREEVRQSLCKEEV